MAKEPTQKSDWGEFELISRLAARLKAPLPEGVIGPGDDCAAIPTPRGMQLVTCDIAVAGRHFLPGQTPMADVGWRIATANVSDVCACGGLPTFALVSLGVPPGQSPEELDELYAGLDQASSAYGFQVLGGNVSGAGELIVDLFMLGETERFISRGGARPGDLIAVSGALGGAAAGLEAFQDAARSPASQSPASKPPGLQQSQTAQAARALIARHLRPRARTDLVPLLQSPGKGATAAIDISDGLASELHHLARASGVQLAVEGVLIPCLAGLSAHAHSSHAHSSRDSARGRKPLDYALTSGEEYELLFTLPPDLEGELSGTDVTVIGQVLEGEGVLLDGRPLPDSGWDHLRGDR